MYIYLSNLFVCTYFLGVHPVLHFCQTANIYLDFCLGCKKHFVEGNFQPLYQLRTSVSSFLYGLIMTPSQSRHFLTYYMWPYSWSEWWNIVLYIVRLTTKGVLSINVNHSLKYMDTFHKIVIDICLLWVRKKCKIVRAQTKRTWKASRK